MTQDEAKREAVRRWGPSGWAMFFPVAKAYGKPPYEVGATLYHGAGKSYEDAFENARTVIQDGSK